MDKEQVFSDLVKLPVLLDQEVLNNQKLRAEAFEYNLWALNNDLLDRRYSIIGTDHFPLPEENDDENLPF